GDSSHQAYVWLRDGTGNIHYQNSSSTTLNYDSTIIAPIGLTAEPAEWTNVNSFSLIWTNPADLSGIVGAYYKLDSAPTSDTDGTYVAGANIEKITGITVSGDGSHQAYVWLRDGAGNIHHQNSSSTTLNYDSTIMAPIGLTAEPVGRTNVNSFDLTWTNPADLSGIVGAYYKLDSAPTSDTDGTYVGGININRIEGINVAGNGSHPVYVWLLDSAGNLLYLNHSQTTFNLDIIPPANTEITYHSVSRDSVTLVWNLIFDGNVDHYNIYRSSLPIDNITNMSPIASVASNVNSYTDSGLSDGSYYYVVTAVDDLGQESLISNNLSVRINVWGPITIIIIIIFGITGVGVSSTYLIYRKRRVSRSQKVSTKKKLKKTTQLDPDLVKQLMDEHSNKTYTLPEIKNEKIQDLKGLLNGLNDEEKTLVITEYLSIPESEREDLRKKVATTKSKEELMKNIDQSLKAMETFILQNKFQWVLKEYEKILSIAEELGDNQLYERIQSKIEELKIKLTYQKES
ncbi:MAG: hypothetical protein ACTSVY_14655, partial [Candidatus Helarchaeota archaeon]